MDQGHGHGQHRSDSLQQPQTTGQRRNRKLRRMLALIALAVIAFTVWMNRGPSDPDVVAIRPATVVPRETAASSKPNPIADLTNLKKLTGPGTGNQISHALDEFVASEPGLPSSYAGPILIPTQDEYGTQVRQAQHIPSEPYFVRSPPIGAARPHGQNPATEQFAPIQSVPFNASNYHPLAVPSIGTSQGAWLTGTIEPVGNDITDVPSRFTIQ